MCTLEVVVMLLESRDLKKASPIPKTPYWSLTEAGWSGDKARLS